MIVASTVDALPGTRPHVGWPTTLFLLLVTLAVGMTTVAVDPGAPITYRWPVAGVAVAALLLADRRRWPAVLVAIAGAATAAQVADGRELAAALALGGAAAAGIVVATLVVRGVRDDIEPRLSTQGDFVRLLVAAAAGGLVAGGLSALVAVTVMDGAATLSAFGRTYGAHSASILVTVPVALTYRGPREPGRLGELAAQVTATGIATAVAFAPDQQLALVFLPLPLLVWGALRFSLRTVAFEVFALACLVTVLTVRGYGPFGAALDTGLVDVAGVDGMRQAYAVCAVVLALPLAIAVQQRDLLLRRVSADEQLFRRNFTESLVGMVLMRQQGDSLAIVDANETAARILGSDRESLTGRALESLLVVEGAMPTTITRVRPDGPHGWRGRAEVAARPGSRIDVAVSLLSADPRALVWSAQLLDVTAEHDARRRLENAEN